MDVIALQPSRPEHVVKFPFSLVSGFLNGTKGEWKETNFLLDAPALNPSHSTRSQDGKISKCEHIFSSSITGEGRVRRLRHHGVAFNPLTVDRRKKSFNGRRHH